MLPYQTPLPPPKKKKKQSRFWKWSPAKCWPPHKYKKPAPIVKVSHMSVIYFCLGFRCYLYIGGVQTNEVTDCKESWL